MNKETFPRLLRHPASLSRLNFEELRSLTEDYPYAQNLRYLLAKKAKMENRPEFERLLHLAAIYSIDREYLNQLIEGTAARSTEAEPLQLEGERLRTDELSLDQLPKEELILQDPEQEIARPEEEPLPAASAAVSEPANTGTPGFTLRDLMHLSDDEPLPSVSDLSNEDAFVETTEEGQQHEDPPTGSSTDLENPPTGESKLSEVEKFLAERARRKTEEPTPGAAFTGAAGLGALVSTGMSDEADMEIPGNDIREEATDPKASTDPDSETPEASTYADSDVDPPGAADQETDHLSIGEAMPPVIASGVVVPPVESYPEEAAPVPEEPPTEDAQTDDLWREIEHAAETRPEVPEPILREREEILHRKTPLTLTHLLAGKQDPDFAKYRKKRARKAKRDKARSTAKRSLQESGELVSETLAQLLERQGHTDRAIEMYEQLSLIYPEKSSFFARKIETLRDQ